MIIIKGSGGESGANVRLLLHSTKEMSFFCTLWVHLLIEKCRAFGGVDNPVLRRGRRGKYEGFKLSFCKYIEKIDDWEMYIEKCILSTINLLFDMSPLQKC